MPYGVSNKTYDFNLNKTQLNALQMQINKTKNCVVDFQKEISDKGNGLFEVKYSIVPSGDCSYAGGNSGSGSITAQKDTVVFEVNLKNNSVKATKGGFDEVKTKDQKEILDLQFKLFELMDGCMKAFLLGVNPVNQINEINSFKEDFCITSADSPIEITYFEPEPKYLILHVKNNSDSSIELTGFTGSSDLTCNACPQTIASGKMTVFNLMGEFSGKVKEQLTINYTLNGLDYSVLSDCTGTVIAIEKLEQESNVIEIDVKENQQSQNLDLNLTIIDGNTVSP